MRVNENIAQISAEMLLNYIEPALQERWVAQHEGSFYRNYSKDVLQVDTELKEVLLARDGYLRLLPEGLLVDENALRGNDFKSRYKQLEMKRRVFREAFKPIDTYAFRQQLRIEGSVSQLLQEKQEYILKTYFNIDLSQESNVYVREMAGLLPYVRYYRGNIGFIARLLGVLLHCRTRVVRGKYSQTDNSRAWLPSVEFQLLISGLTANDYRELYEQTRPLERLIKEWMMPAELHSMLTIKHHGERLTTDRVLTLDYDTELGDEE